MGGPESFWDLPALGELAPQQRAAFYDAIAEEENARGEAGLSLRGGSESFENPRLWVGIVEDNYSVVPAIGYFRKPTLRKAKVNVFLERYFVHAMPGRDFDLQMVIETRHRFEDRLEPSEVAHTFAVKGIEGDYVSCLGEPVFSHLSIEDTLLLRIGVTFLGDRRRDQILKLLNSDYVKKGLLLATAYNPVFGAAASYVQSIATALLIANKNRIITKADITLFSSPGPLSTPLVDGTYILVQPRRGEEKLDFGNARFDRSRDRVLLGDQPLNRNHMVMRVQPVRK